MPTSAAARAAGHSVGAAMPAGGCAGGRTAERHAVGIEKPSEAHWHGARRRRSAAIACIHTHPTGAAAA